MDWRLTVDTLWKPLQWNTIEGALSCCVVAAAMRPFRENVRVVSFFSDKLEKMRYEFEERQDGGLLSSCDRGLRRLCLILVASMTIDVRTLHAQGRSATQSASLSPEKSAEPGQGVATNQTRIHGGDDRTNVGQITAKILELTVHSHGSEGQEASMHEAEERDA
ncbi:hypothetical protein VTN77DRAFT_3170 [Rasamsonia byssochlamydoides]|uniref:uncharacterized protein n=1 Tax=Rasamsonia byssochlamydoides TaxID=89139 RepID=UPI003742832B